MDGQPNLGTPAPGADFQAALLSIREVPAKSIVVPEGLEGSPATRALADALATAARTVLTSNGVRPGCFDRIRATSPATWGAAKLFPVATVLPPSFQAIGTLTAKGINPVWVWKLGVVPFNQSPMPSSLAFG